jgi:hypothetical protein
MSGLASRLNRFIPEKEPQIGGWVGFTGGLDQCFSTARPGEPLAVHPVACHCNNYAIPIRVETVWFG